MEREIKLEINYINHHEVVLTNGRGDTFTYDPQTSNGEELSDFLYGATPLPEPEVVKVGEVLDVLDENLHYYKGDDGENHIDMFKLAHAVNDYYISKTPISEPEVGEGAKAHYEALQDCCNDLLKAVDSGKVPKRQITGLRILLPPTASIDQREEEQG